jgi:hypothetical protein
MCGAFSELHGNPHEYIQDLLTAILDTCDATLLADDVMAV